MSELAFNMNGEAFEVPAASMGWRVRRMKLKGAPEVVYGKDGLPLILPLDAGVEDVRHEVGGVPGRYRLDPVGDNNRPLPDAPAGYVYVHPERRVSEPPIKEPIAVTTDSAVIEAMRMNAELARTVIDRFPQMMEAAAQLLRAADGAGLPARPGTVAVEVDDEEEVVAAGGFDLNALVAQVVPMLVMGFMSGNTKVPKLAEMMDWRKAAAAAKPASKAALVEAASTTPSTAVTDAEPGAAGVEPMVPPLDAATMAHFMAVRAALTPEESALAGRIAQQLTAAELRGLLDELAKLSVPDAASRVRELLGGPATRGVVS